MTGKVKLIPIAQRRPNDNFVSAPSKIRPSIEISQSEFEAKYAAAEHIRSVSFAADGVSDPQPTTAYGRLRIYIKG